MNFVKLPLEQLSTAFRRIFIGPVIQGFSELLDSKLGPLGSKLESELNTFRSELNTFRSELNTFRSDVSGKLAKFGGDLSSVRKDVGRLASQNGHLFELSVRGVVQEQLPGAGPPRNLHRAEDVAAVLTLEGDPVLPNAMLLACALLFKDVGFWHLLLHSVKKVMELARGQNPTSSVAVAAKELQEMGADRFVQAMATAAAASMAAAVGSSQGQQYTSSIAVQAPQMRLHDAYLLKVVQLLHQSGAGRMLFADELEMYQSAEGARVNLLLDRTVPFLTAVATGVALPELELDRCSSLSLRSWAPVPSAELQLAELKLSSSGFKEGRKQVEPKATAIAWAYHAARLTPAVAYGAAATRSTLPPVLNVQAHLLSLPNGKPKQAPPESYRIEALPVLGCPLTVYYSYYIVRAGRMQRWRW
ncbi:hypothetical protein HYH02_014099 [Chlamydomonas schloesseri]|uniref:Uncharacterized protein n=1 Tax=Chlamydomonas schloesseri TaxID=2026947 RepID=A0A835VXH2_9CHLO|nr:hypothetical protein HYH02_014099 [Chlamydomonas schloesseri]|eukprot:KAG2429164.1 hypothetical protein HYH02_014099 [Chlamydomonas schloesseri]